MVYIGISLLHLGFWWGIISMGVDVKPIFNFLSVSPPPALASASTFAAAYIVHKLLAPLRIAVIVAVLGRYGKRLSNVMTSSLKMLGGKK